MTFQWGKTPEVKQQPQTVFKKEGRRRGRETGGIYDSFFSTA